MTVKQLTLETDGNALEMTAPEGTLYKLRNAVATAMFDGRFPTDTAKSLREDIPRPNDTLTQATFELDRERVTLLADALEEAQKAHRDNDRPHTADTLDNTAKRLRFYTGKLTAE